MTRDFRVTIPAREIPNFACSDARVNDRGWEIAMVGSVHRDAGTVARSNARTLRGMLTKLDPNQDHWGVLGASHWAVGWIEHIVVDTNHEPIMRELHEVTSALSEYPVLNDSDHSELEREDHDTGRCEDGCSYCYE